jgi:hypothetical protein
MDLGTKVMHPNQITTADGHGQGKFQLFQLMTTLDVPAGTRGYRVAGRRSGRGKRMGESHGSLSFHSAIPGQSQAAMGS